MTHLLVGIENIVRQFNTILLQNSGSLSVSMIGAFLNERYTTGVSEMTAAKKPPDNCQAVETEQSGKQLFLCSGE